MEVNSVVEQNYKQALEIQDHPQLVQLFGSQDQHLRLLEETFETIITHREEQLLISGEEDSVKQTIILLEQLQELIARGISISQTDIVTAIKMAKRGTLDYFLNLYNEEIGRTFVLKLLDNNNTFMRLREQIWCLELDLQELGKLSSQL